MNQVLVEGTAKGRLMVLDEPLSFWGGFDSEGGTIIDRAHPQLGESIAGVILAMPHGRGSSSSATVIAEALRRSTGPSGFVLEQVDEIIVTGVFVANSLYGTAVPVVVTPLPVDSRGVYHLDADGLRRHNAD